ncbi:MAG: septum formation initiator family protein [Eubacterium sp.]|nr:septum formation initiator family protein [Eubacterium sp.]
MSRIKQELASKSWGRIVIMTILVTVILFSAFSLIKNHADISRLQAQAAQYEQQYNQQIKENEKIKAILDSDNKDEYIEQKAREKGYVKDGEVVFYDISD